MFEKFLTNTREDFRQRYTGTYGFFKDETGKRTLVRLTHINEEVTFVDQHKLSYSLRPDSEKDVGFEFIPPKSCFYNTAEGAMFGKRVAARQFVRGVSDRNYRMWGLRATGFKPLTIGFTTLEAAYVTKVTVPQALEAYDSGATPSVALDEQFAIVRTADKEQVYLWDTVIGIAFTQKNSIFFNLENKTLFRTELNDALKGIRNVEFL